MRKNVVKSFINEVGICYFLIVRDRLMPVPTIPIISFHSFAQAFTFHLSVRANLATLVACENKFSLTRLHKLSLFTFQFVRTWLHSLRVKINFHSLVCTSFHFSDLTFQFISYPIIRVAENLDPWCHIISQVICRICSTLPWEDCTLWVRHHRYVTAVCTCKGCYVVV